MKILVIPDSHATHGVSNERFDWVGNCIVEERPDIIIDIGDSADMSSLCKYDMGTVAAEGRRYFEDLQVYHDACARVFTPVRRFQNKIATHKKKKYNPRFIKCHGNHEARIDKAAKATPNLYGHLSYRDLKEEEFGWEVHKYLTPVTIEGITFQHCFTSGVMGRPIGGENVASAIVKKGYCSCVQGHSHTLDFWEDRAAHGGKVFGLSVGCYLDHPMDYTSEQGRWWSGLVMLHGAQDGYATPELITYNEVKKRYG
jgi:ribosomal protein S30